MKKIEVFNGVDMQVPEPMGKRLKVKINSAFDSHARRSLAQVRSPHSGKTLIEEEEALLSYAPFSITPTEKELRYVEALESSGFVSDTLIPEDISSIQLPAFKEPITVYPAHKNTYSAKPSVYIADNPHSDDIVVTLGAIPDIENLRTDKALFDTFVERSREFYATRGARPLTLSTVVLPYAEGATEPDMSLDVSFVGATPEMSQSTVWGSFANKWAFMCAFNELARISCNTPEVTMRDILHDSEALSRIRDNVAGMKLVIYPLTCKLLGALWKAGWPLSADKLTTPARREVIMDATASDILRLADVYFSRGSVSDEERAKIKRSFVAPSQSFTVIVGRAFEEFRTGRASQENKSLVTPQNVDELIFSAHLRARSDMFAHSDELGLSYEEMSFGAPLLPGKRANVSTVARIRLLNFLGFDYIKNHARLSTLILIEEATMAKKSRTLPVSRANASRVAGIVKNIASDVSDDFEGCIIKEKILSEFLFTIGDVMANAKDIAKRNIAQVYSFDAPLATNLSLCGFPVDRDMMKNISQFDRDKKRASAKVLKRIMDSGN